jgi:hypothetical protein
MNPALILCLIFAIAAVSFIILYVPLKSRGNYLRDFCRRSGLSFSEKENSLLDRIKFFNIYQAAPIREAALNVIRSRAGSPEICIFDYKTETESSGPPKTTTQTIFYFKDTMKLPGFRFYPKARGGTQTRKQESVFKYRPIVFSSCPAFSEQNQMVGPDDNEIREFFSAELLEKLARFRNLWVEGYGSELLIYRRGRIVGGKGINRHYKSARAILRLFQEHGSA